MTASRFASLVFVALPLAAEIGQPERSKIDSVTGAKGAYTADEDVYRVTFPRTDVKVTVEGRPMHPIMGLTSWAAFTPDAHGGLMVMGDLVLFEDEVNGVMSAALENGLEVTALHNHFFFESPRVMFMHIGGMGTAEKLAGAVKKALDQVNVVRGARAQPGAQFAGPAVPEASSISASAIDAILGVKGQSNAGMYKALIGRKAQMHGRTVGNQMGVNTWAAFAGSDENAFVDGDFAMTEGELQPVLKALRQAGINVVAIHNHMTHEEPQYVFLHYWGKGNAAGLARGLRKALDTQQTAVRAGKVVFICEHGAAKSVMAAAYFNKLAAERGLADRAISRGTAPDAAFPAGVLAGLRGDGYEAPTGQPQRVGAADLAGAKRVVTFAVKVPEGMATGSSMGWDDVPSPSANYGVARDDIRRRVEKLVAEMAAAH